VPAFSGTNDLPLPDAAVAALPVAPLLLKVSGDGSQSGSGKANRNFVMCGYSVHGMPLSSAWESEGLDAAPVLQGYNRHESTAGATVHREQLAAEMRQLQKHGVVVTVPGSAWQKLVVDRLPGPAQPAGEGEGVGEEGEEGGGAMMS
jgi:hypothetical protein